MRKNSLMRILEIIKSPIIIISPLRRENQPVGSTDKEFAKSAKTPIPSQKIIPEPVSAFRLGRSLRANLRIRMMI